MGAVTFSLDPLLLDCLRGVLHSEVFVETGTFEGATAELAASRFLKVHTVELSHEYWQIARERLGAFPSVNLHEGESSTVLKQIGAGLKSRKVIYWLDAHWCDIGESAGAETQCPLLAELDAIGFLNSDSAVLIDDARLFLCPPPGSHRAEQWPTFDSIVRRLLTLGADHRVAVLNDVICLVPEIATSALRQLALDQAYDWLEAAQKARQYDEMFSQLDGKDKLINELHFEAGRLQRELAQTTLRVHQLDKLYHATSDDPVKLLGLCARALARKCRRTLGFRKSA
jgi:hypothetical protein